MEERRGKREGFCLCGCWFLCYLVWAARKDSGEQELGRRDFGELSRWGGCWDAAVCMKLWSFLSDLSKSKVVAGRTELFFILVVVQSQSLLRFHHLHRPLAVCICECLSFCAVSPNVCLCATSTTTKIFNYVTTTKLSVLPTFSQIHPPHPSPWPPLLFSMMVLFHKCYVCRIMRYVFCWGCFYFNSVQFFWGLCILLHINVPLCCYWGIFRGINAPPFA